MQEAAVEDGSDRHFLDVVVILDVAACTCGVDARWHAALNVEIETACEGPVESVVVPQEERRLEGQSRYVAAIVGG